MTGEYTLELALDASRRGATDFLRETDRSRANGATLEEAARVVRPRAREGP